LSYSANYDALRFFLDEIWPLIRSRRPDARLRVTGRLDGSLDGLAVDSHVEFTGYLPDIRPAVAASWLSVVPLRMGGGTRLKILESMALGTPVVATSKGAEGLGVTSGRDILLADGPSEFAEAVIRLLDSPELREHLAINGRQVVASKYDWNEIGQRFNALVEQVAQK
jgi:glycosyltransferase involved in cell wall biosynthesis